jgi:aromatic-amino-acid transaminase
MFQELQSQPDDALLTLIGLFKKDQRPTKIDLGVGMFRDENGETPVMQVVKAAERMLLECQRTKGYLGPEGDQRFVELLSDIILDNVSTFGDRLVGVQTPGGGGALRLGAELVAAARPHARVWVGSPTWPNHQPVLASAGLNTEVFRYFDVGSQSLRFDETLDVLSNVPPGDVILLQGCCHNPTGADLDKDQWNRITNVLIERKLVPFVDFAYHGLGRGLEKDAYGVRCILARVEEALVAYSCDKNFGLYRERTGALLALGQNPGVAKTMRDNLSALARVNWSMPPDHGAAVVRTILESKDLTGAWGQELERMRRRITDVRHALAAADPQLAFLTRQSGMFSQLPISLNAVARLRAEYGIYMPTSGRVNLAGLRLSDIPVFLAGLEAVGTLPYKKFNTSGTVNRFDAEVFTA